jgi:4'-phosphopantetheinyl transferase
MRGQNIHGHICRPVNDASTIDKKHGAFYSRHVGRITAEVWWADPAWLQPWHNEILDPVERARAARYRLDSDRARFVLAAALLRLVAGRELGLPPGLVAVDRHCARCGGPHGRPTIIDAGFSVSVAHSAQRVLLGLSMDGTVGVDVEQVRAIDISALRPLVLSTAELQSTQTVDDFFKTWVRKEAVLKALGTGLNTAMSSVVLGPADTAPSVVAIGGRSRLDLLLVDIDADPGYAAALANVPAPGQTAGTVAATPPAVTVRVYRDEAAALLGRPAPTPSSGRQIAR